MPRQPDLRVCLTTEQCWQPVPGGSGTYIVELSRELARLDGLTVTGIAARHASPPARDWQPAVPVRHSRLPRRLLYDAWQRLSGPRAESIAGGSDVVHATTWAVPATRRPLVVTVHDLAFLHDSSHFTARGNRYFRRALEQTRRSATAIIVPSRSTADDCIAAGLPAARISVIPHGSRPEPRTAEDVAELRARYSLDRDYVLWCGTIEPRKNLPALLDAFASAASELDGLDLVLVGPVGWGDLPAVPAGLVPERVKMLGPLSRRDLHTAYAGATAFCYPSLREGFGLPVLEAMQHGLPVVTSRGTACAEVAGDAGVLADPRDSHDIARALVTAVRGRDDLAALSRTRAKDFTWTAAAARTASVYRDAATAGGPPAAVSRR